MKKYMFYLISTVVLLSSVACQRQKLEEPYRFLSHIPVAIDWSESLLDMKQVGNVSLYFYPKDGGEPIVKVSDDLYYNLIELPIGEYSVLIFNDMINNVVGISYSNENSLNDFSVNMIEKTGYKPPFYETGTDEVVATPHSRMAGWSLGELVVDESLVEYTRSAEFEDYIAEVKSRAATRMSASNAGTNSPSSETTTETRISMPASSTEITKSSSDALHRLSNVVTQPITTIINYKVRVKNLNSAMQFGVMMKGSARGAYLAKDENIPTDENRRNIYDLIVRNREYDDPNKGIDGYVNFTLNTFGREPQDEKYELSFKIILQTGELVEIEREITDQMMMDDDHIIDIELDGQNELVLPENVKTGFNVNEWGDDVIIYL